MGALPRLFGVSHLTAVDPTEIWVRTSTEDRTFQVAGAMLAAMQPCASGQPWKVHTQPASVCSSTVATEPNTYIVTATGTKKEIDSLVPAYACPTADAIRNAFQAVPAWTTQTNASLNARLDAVFGTAALDAWASWCERKPYFVLVSFSFACSQTTTFSTR
jgi:hypothetical protein